MSNPSSPSQAARTAHIAPPNDPTARPRLRSPFQSTEARLPPTLHGLAGAPVDAVAEAPILSLAARRWLERMRLGIGATTQRVLAAFSAEGGTLERRAPGAPGLSRSEAALLAAFQAGYLDQPLAAEDALTSALGRRPGDALLGALLADSLAHRVCRRSLLPTTSQPGSTTDHRTAAILYR